MRELQIRNPTARSATRFVIAGAFLLVWLCVASSVAGPQDGLGHSLLATAIFVGPFFLGSLLAGILSWFARVTLTAEGLRVRSLWDHALYPWHTIGGVRRHTTEYRSNTSRSIDRTVEILVDGRWKELPAPKASKFIGRQEYERDAIVIAETLRRLGHGATR